MRCPHCKKYIKSPTKRQLLCWVHRYFGGLSFTKRIPFKEVGKQMGITPGAAVELIQRFRKAWPGLAPKKQPRKKTVTFDEERDSKPKITF